MKKTACTLAALSPFWAYLLIYWLLGKCPNYQFNDIDIRGIYETEKALFGIGGLTPGEWFLQHTHAVFDFIAGFSYLCWLPVPICYGIWMCLRRQQPAAPGSGPFSRVGYNQCFNMLMAFLVVNLLGFVGYYLHPAAAPWYPMAHGFEPDFTTPGSAAGMARFDQLVGLGIFHGFYDKNANVFAAMPSLHSAYILIATIYAFIYHERRWFRTILVLLCLGTWFGAVYTCHHYVLDVVAGIAVTALGVALYHSDKFIGTGFGSGYWPWGPGTAGALVATLLWLGGACCSSFATLQVLTFILIVAFTLCSIRPINRLECIWGPDPSRVVIDEVVGVWISLLAVPADSIMADGTFTTRFWVYTLLAFVLFRFFDILKPLGVRRMERFPGGWGVMLDDILAGVYGAIVMLALRLIY